MGDVLDAVSARIKAPYFGYAVLAFIALNWRAIFILVMTNGSPEVRVAKFDSMTSNWSLFFAPLLVGAIVAATTAWIRLIFEHLSRKPLEEIMHLQLQAEHKKEKEKNRLAMLFAKKEDLLINDAKRDQEIQNIEDEVVKQRVQKEVEKLRAEREEMIGSKPFQLLSPRQHTLLKESAKNGSGVIRVKEYMDGQEIRAGAVSLGGESVKDFKLMKDALYELKNKGLLEERGLTGDHFELTGRGWEMAEKFSSKS